MNKKYHDFTDDVNGRVIGRIVLCATLHKYETGEQVGPKFYGDLESNLVGQAEAWLAVNGGKEIYPDGLQLRIR